MRLLFTILASLFLLTAACTFTQKIKDGPTAFEQKQYHLAVELLDKEFTKEQSRVEKGKIAYLIGASYREMNEMPKAIDWYRTAYDYQYGVEALRDYAYALKENEQYTEAMAAFKELGIEIGSPYEYRKEISACQIAIGWLENPTKEYEVQNLDFNTNKADYAPILYEDNQLVFTSDRSTATGDDIYQWTGNNFSDLFVVDLSSDQVQPFDPSLNSTFNEGTAVFNRDFTEVYFTRCYAGEKYEDNFCKLMMSQRSGTSWTVPVLLNFVQDKINYMHPALTADGNTLYFASDDPEGWGGFDIYRVERTPEGWGLPVLLGRSINTPDHEQFPYLDQDTLYFASSGHTGMGGLDIFKIYLRKDGKWSSAQNLQAPINTSRDDFAYIIDRSSEPTDPNILQTGYFSSTRKEGQGGDDIYRFNKVIPPPTPVAELPKPEDYQLLLKGYVLEKIFVDPTNPNSKVLGRKPLPGSEVLIQYGQQSKTVTVDEDGSFSLILDEETDYSFLASKEGYLKNETRFSSKGIGKDPNNPVQTFEIEIELDKIYRNLEIVLEDIYYDFDEAFIREDAKPTLDELVKNLQLNPDLRIQMASHTDCRGNPRYNEDLSQRRAEAAVGYLISKGIESNRLEARGYGENAPAVDCVCNRCTEAEHQENRRTTFSIIE